MLSSLVNCFLVVYSRAVDLDVGRSGLQSSVQCYSGVSVGAFLLVLALEVIHDKLCLLADSSDLLIG